MACTLPMVEGLLLCHEAMVLHLNSLHLTCVEEFLHLFDFDAFAFSCLLLHLTCVERLLRSFLPNDFVESEDSSYTLPVRGLKTAPPKREGAVKLFLRSSLNSSRSLAIFLLGAVVRRMASPTRVIQENASRQLHIFKQITLNKTGDRPMIKENTTTWGLPPS